ncbi:MAG: CFI-box-CTERM domain-containing protein [Promethearchaeota archaeon]
MVDDLGPYNPTQWRFFRYAYDPDPLQEQSRYFELKTDWTDEQNFDYGRGYWVISKYAKKICIDGAPVTRNWVILDYRGDRWNQIGNIYDYEFPIVSLYVARVSSLFDQKQLIDPGTNDLTYLTLQEFENGQYIDIPTLDKDSLEGGKGYWLRVEEDVGENVVLWFIVESSTQSKEIYLNEEFFEKVAQQDLPPDPPAGIEGPSSGSSSSGSGGCFIATAAYGDYDHRIVQLMREFRDRYLLTNSLGRAFVDLYYRYSPTLASFMAKRESIKALVRVNLTPIVGASAVLSKMNMCGFLIAVAFCFFGSLFFLRRRKGAWGECKTKFSGKMKGEKRRE